LKPRPGVTTPDAVPSVCVSVTALPSLSMVHTCVVHEGGACFSSPENSPRSIFCAQ
jgi:hypothetical protein